jgi:hypothetical protein
MPTLLEIELQQSLDRRDEYIAGLEKKIAEFKELWSELVSNADDQKPFDVCISRADYETMMSFADDT